MTLKLNSLLIAPEGIEIKEIVVAQNEMNGS
jgi:hypothetical protein